ncbi:MAG: DUF4360 domain-containing protein [Bdellovibrionota bacterium]
MRSFLLKLILLSIATLGLSKAFAEQVVLGQAQMAGTGCPAGTAVAVLSPSNDTISILFSAFQITKEATEVTMNKVASCRIIIPVTVPAGYALLGYQLDYRGYLHLEDPKGSFIFRSMPLVNPRIPVVPKDQFITGVYDGPLEISHYLDSYRCNNCGGQFNLQVELTLGVYGEGRILNPLQGTAIATIDSADGFIPTPGGNGVKFRFGLTPCAQNPGSVNPPPRPPPQTWPPQNPWPRPNQPPPNPWVQPPPRPNFPPPVPVKNPGQCYLERYPDICAASPKNFCRNPEKHYRQHGQFEGRIWGCQ